MHVDHRGLHRATQRVCPQRGIDRRERIVEGAAHEDIAQHLRDQHLAPAPVGKDARTAPGGRLGEVERAQDGRIALDLLEHVLLVEGVIAKRDHIGAGLQQTPRMRSRQPHAARGVLAIDHHEIERPVGAQRGQTLRHRRTPRAPHHIAQKQDFHGRLLGQPGIEGKRPCRRLARVTVRTPPAGVFGER